MSEAIVCDECGRTVTEYQAVGWYIVDTEGADIRMTHDMPWPRHYCSADCLREAFTDDSVQPVQPHETAGR